MALLRMDQIDPHEERNTICRILNYKYEQDGDFTNFTIQLTIGDFSWTVDRRYSQFHEFDKKRFATYSQKSFLPPKKLVGNKDSAFLEERRSELESYLRTVLELELWLQKKKQKTSLPRPISKFLDFHKYEVHGIVESIAEQTSKNGDQWLDGMVNDKIAFFDFNTVDLFAVTQRLKLPEPTAGSGGSKTDIGHVLDFMHQLPYLRIKGCGKGMTFGTSNIHYHQLTFSLAPLKSLKALWDVLMDKDLMSLPAGAAPGSSSSEEGGENEDDKKTDSLSTTGPLSTAPVPTSTATSAPLATTNRIKRREAEADEDEAVVGNVPKSLELLLKQDKAWEKSESYRSSIFHVQRGRGESFDIQPVQPLQQSTTSKSRRNEDNWPAVIDADFCFNEIQEIDQSINLVPNVEKLDLSHNRLTEIGSHLQHLTKLRELNVSNNGLERIESLHTKLGNVKRLTLAGNSIRNLHGLSKMYSLEELDVRMNAITQIEDVWEMGSLPCLHSFHLAGNPIENAVDYRTRVLESFGNRAHEIFLDEEQGSQRELDTVGVRLAIRKAKEEKEKCLERTRQQLGEKLKFFADETLGCAPPDSEDGGDQEQDATSQDRRS